MSFVLLGVANLGRRHHHRPHHAGELDERFPLHRVPRLLPARGQGPGEHRQGRSQRHHRAQSRQLPRSAAGDGGAAEAAGLRHRRRRCRSAGGSSRCSKSCAPWRSIRSSRFRCATIINAVRDGDTLVIFPEGRITVTGSLMKVYDGAGLIADKSDAMVVPVRIEGPEATIFSRLKRSQVRRRWFPKITVTVLEPVKLKVDPELKGRKRRQAAGAALYTIMSDLIFRTTSTDRTVVEALIDAAKIHGPNWLAIEDPVSGQMTYKRLLQAAAVLGAQADAAGARRPRARRHAADLERRGRHLARGDVGRARAGHDQLHRRRRQHPRCLPCRRSRHHSHLARLRRKGPARPSRRGAQQTGAHRLSGGHSPDRSAFSTSCAARCIGRSRWLRASPTIGRRSCSPRARKARRRASCCPIATCWRTWRRPRPASISAAKTSCSTCCRYSIPSA